MSTAAACLGLSFAPGSSELCKKDELYAKILKQSCETALADKQKKKSELCPHPEKLNICQPLILKATRNSMSALIVEP